MLYIKLAADNIKKNGKAYIPYISACAVTAAMFYIMRSLSLNKDLWNLKRGSAIVPELMALGAAVTGIFAAIFLFYTNGFLMKQRKKEFGLYNILGMGKGHISRVIALETLYVAAISISLGLAGGIALDKLMYLIIARIIGADVVLGFYISSEAILNVLILFGTVFLLIMLIGAGQIRFFKPVDLLTSRSRGEREPKAKPLVTVLGTLCLGTGYAVSLAATDVRDAFEKFFAAVLLVMAGTYMLFSAGSVFLLKALKKKKSYYYKTKHFTAVSGMIHRMKQNAAGLANICILSTMVLVMLSATLCLMTAAEITVNYKYPYDITIQLFNAYENDGGSLSAKALESIRDIINENSDCTEIKGDYDYLAINCDIITDEADIGSFDTEYGTILTVLTAQEHNKFGGDDIVLDEADEIAIITSNYDYKYGSLKIFGTEYTVKQNGRKDFGSHDYFSSTATTVIVRDREALLKINGEYAEYLGEEKAHNFLNHRIDFDVTDRSRWEQSEDGITKAVEAVSSYSYIDGKDGAREEYMSIYGGLFFLGVFLSLLFTMAAILIIYYKQISEGYEDKKRFEIMRNVGMSKSEVKASIHSQVLTVFFIPLIAAGVHSAFAFPIISNMIELTGFSGDGLLALCMAGCFLAYAVLYVIIYAVTARAYYKIVSA